MVDPLLTLTAGIYVGSSSSESSWQFGTTGSNGIGFAGGIDIEDGTDVVAITGSYPVIGSITRDTWHTVSLTLNYATQTYSVSVDGSVLASGLSFCGNNFGTCNGAPVTSMGWDIFDSFGGGNDLGAMDNFVIASVPEPATWAMMLIGFAGLGFARYRASAVSLFGRPANKSTMPL